jgi:PH domain
MQNLGAQSGAYKEKVKAILSRKYEDIGMTIGGDLPRLAKLISIKDEQGSSLITMPTDPDDVFTFVRAVIFTLKDLFHSSVAVNDCRQCASSSSKGKKKSSSKISKSSEEEEKGDDQDQDRNEECGKERESKRKRKSNGVDDEDDSNNNDDDDDGNDVAAAAGSSGPKVKSSGDDVTPADFDEWFKIGKHLPERLRAFLARLGGDESDVVRILKVCNQASTAAGVIELKVVLGFANTTKDMANTWHFDIVVTDDRVVVENHKREESMKKTFEFEWNLTTTFARPSLELVGVSLVCSDLVFASEAPLEQQHDVCERLDAYMLPSLRDDLRASGCMLPAGTPRSSPTAAASSSLSPFATPSKKAKKEFLPMAADVLKQGYLRKVGGKNRKRPGNWQRRWFVLKRDGALDYFKKQPTKAGKEPVSSIDAKSATLLETCDDVTKKLNSFSLTTDERVFFFQATTRAEVDEWLGVLQQFVRAVSSSPRSSRSMPARGSSKASASGNTLPELGSVPPRIASSPDIVRANSSGVPLLKGRKDALVSSSSAKGRKLRSKSSSSSPSSSSSGHQTWSPRQIRSALLHGSKAARPKSPLSGGSGADNDIGQSDGAADLAAADSPFPGVQLRDSTTPRDDIPPPLPFPGVTLREQRDMPPGLQAFVEGKSKSSKKSVGAAALHDIVRAEAPAVDDDDIDEEEALRRATAVLLAVAADSEDERTDDSAASLTPTTKKRKSKKRSESSLKKEFIAKSDSKSSGGDDSESEHCPTRHSSGSDVASKRKKKSKRGSRVIEDDVKDECDSAKDDAAEATLLVPAESAGVPKAPPRKSNSLTKLESEHLSAEVTRTQSSKREHRRSPSSRRSRSSSKKKARTLNKEDLEALRRRKRRSREVRDESTKLRIRAASRASSEDQTSPRNDPLTEHIEDDDDITAQPTVTFVQPRQDADEAKRKDEEE